MSEPIIKKRYAVLAVIMSLVSPGFGHLYVGKWKLAIALPFVFAVTYGLLGWTGIIFFSEGMLIALAISVFFYLYVMVSSFLLARNPASHNLNKSQRWYFYILFILAVSVLNSVLLEYRGKFYGYETFHMPSESMLPTVVANDLLVVNTRDYKDREPEPGDVIVFDYPVDPEVKYVKRLVGKGGDHLAYFDKVLYVNGEPLKREFVGPYNGSHVSMVMEEYTEHIAGHAYGITLVPSRQSIEGEFQVPDGYYFVMGDNRDNSSDSRHWGMVPRDYLYGKVEYIWFSFDDELNIRYERLGMRL